MFRLYPVLRRVYPEQPERRTVPSAHISAHLFIANEAPGLGPVACSFGTLRQCCKAEPVSSCPPTEFCDQLPAANPWLIYTLTPLESAVPRNGQASLLESAVPKQGT